MPEEVRQYREQLEGRTMLVRKARVVPIEAIVRGYITGEPIDYLNDPDPLEPLGLHVNRICLGRVPKVTNGLRYSDTREDGRIPEVPNTYLHALNQG